ncbi:MAG: PBP1A family penicillin-binding protein [Sulfurovaceae bacterium]|nr:PBP1A family penicillin-binding protein [Sulfurovaceae bacterium]
MSKIFKLFIKFIIIITIGIVAAMIYAYTQISLDADKLIDYNPEVSSVVLDKNEKRIAYIFKDKHRLYAKYNEIPEKLVYSLIAVEDSGFFEHQGVSPEAILRAIFKDIQAGSFVEGGSTLTQQLIKNTYLTNEKTLGRKIKEAVLALKIEKSLTKEEILERYLNEIFFGNGYYGVKTAANGFFHKELNELTLKESAILVGLPNAPSTLNPVKYYERAINRADTVLFRLKTLGWIDEAQYNEAITERPKVYSSSLTQNLAPYVVDEVIRQYEPLVEDLRTGGYTIYTTIDLKQQEIAQEAVQKVYTDAMRYSPSASLNAALVSMESNTGDILAMVGGVDYKKSAFNRATQATRQPGSSFKPFVYQIALDAGNNPATYVQDVEKIFEYTDNRGNRKAWSPKNYDGTFKGYMTLRQALIESRNLATVNLAESLGMPNVFDKLEVLQIQNMPRDMSIVLGNLSVSPLKMAQVYSVFGNYGKIVEPRLVSKIIAKDGSLVLEIKSEVIAEFTRPEQAYLMTTILQDVVRYGTGHGAIVDGIELAGKTGTTNNNVDAWFCGYSPTIETMIWVGRDDNRPMNSGVTGGGVVAPAFAHYYRKLIAIYPTTKRRFDIPGGVEYGVINGRNEYYTGISPLPLDQPNLDDLNATDANSTDENGSQDGSLGNIFDNILPDSGQAEETMQAF